MAILRRTTAACLSSALEKWVGAMQKVVMKLAQIRAPCGCAAEISDVVASCVMNTPRLERAGLEQAILNTIKRCALRMRSPY